MKLYDAIQARICQLCGGHVEYMAGMHDTRLKLFTHGRGSECFARLEAVKKDFTKSRKGRYRDRRAVLALLGVEA